MLKQQKEEIKKRVLKVGAVLKRKHVNLCRERRRESDLMKVKCQTYTHTGNEVIYELCRVVS